MDNRPIISGLLLAALPVGAGAMTEVGASVFPGRETLIFWIGLLLVAAALAGLAVLATSRRQRHPVPEPSKVKGTAGIWIEGGSNIIVDGNMIEGCGQGIVDKGGVGNIHRRNKIKAPKG